MAGRRRVSFLFSLYIAIYLVHLHMITFDKTIKKISKDLKITQELTKKVLNKTFREIENGLEEGNNFMFKGYVKIVKSKKKKKPISKTELLNLKTKDK